MTLLAWTAALFLAAAPAATVDGLGWMAGSWEGEADGVHMEETWMAPSGGTLLGMHRDVKGTRTVSYEFLRIAEESDTVTYWASPDGRPPVPFRLASAEERRAVFTNPAHDFPQRITYWLDAAGALHARVDALDGSGALEWTWTKR